MMNDNDAGDVSKKKKKKQYRKLRWNIKAGKQIERTVRKKRD